MNKESHLAKLAFIVGAPRSGTTLLMSILNSSPEIHVVPENRFFLVYMGKYKNLSFKKKEVRIAFVKDFKRHLKHRQQIEGLNLDLWKLEEHILQSFINTNDTRNTQNYLQATIALYKSLKLNNSQKKAYIYILKKIHFTRNILENS